jgi:glucose-6-phosphate 1-epimerase
MPRVLFSNNSSRVSQSSISDDISIVTIESNKCSASVSLYAGHVLQWQPKGHKPVFWVSDNAVFELGKAIRGGIPICWPWFGAFPTEMLLNKSEKTYDINSHGFARISQWALKQVKETERGIEIELSFSGDNYHPAWPFAFTLTQRLIFGETFSQELIITNLGFNKADHDKTTTEFELPQAMFTGALHSYFAVGSASETSVHDLRGIYFEDKLITPVSQKKEKPQSKHVPNAVEQCLGPIDRIYHSSKDLFINDKINKRNIKLSTNNTNQWVLWNPGVEIAKQMSDVHSNAENEFVCLEAANTKPIVLPEGKEVKVFQHISLEFSE